VQASPVVVAGADDGAVCVYSVAGMVAELDRDSPPTEEQQRQRLEEALRQHTARHAAG
jgi:hypothetical protein